MKKQHLNYFSKSEQHVHRWACVRNKLLIGPCKILSRLGISADAVSYFGLALIFGFVYYAKSAPIVASVFLIFHVIVDAFDGPLARLTKTASNKGAFTDIVCDSAGMIISSIALIYHELVNATIGASYTVVYVILITFAVVRNKIGITPKTIFRPKYIVYLIYVYYALTSQNWFSQAMLIFTVLMLIFVRRDYFAIKRKL